MASLFTTLIETDSAHFVYEDEVCVAFLDINPAAPGHCLVVPRAEVDQWTDLDKATAAHLMSVAQDLGKVQKQVFGSDRIGLMIAGFEVSHCHLHVIPINSMNDFELGKNQASVEALIENKRLLLEGLSSK